MHTRRRGCLEEELRIGALEGADTETFGQITGIPVSDDGRVAILDGQAQDLRVFDAEGRYLRTLGRRGEGPGEMEGAWGIMQDADGRLWVPDHANHRMSVFDFEDGFVRSYRFESLIYRFVWDGVMGEDGRIRAFSMTLEPERHYNIRIYDSEMSQVDSLLLPDAPETDPLDPPDSFYFESSEGLRGYLAVPYYPTTHQVLDPSGELWTTEPGDAAYRLTRWEPGSGDTTLILELQREVIPVSSAERDSVIADVREALHERGTTRQDWSKIPDVKPSVRAIHPVGGGRVWVETSSPDTLRRFDVFEGDGVYTGSIATTLDVFRYVSPIVRGDSVWLVVVDEFEVPYVVRARLSAPTAQ